MGAQDKRPFARDADLRKAASDFASQGFAVKITADREIIILPVGAQPQIVDQFDLLDFKR